MSNPVQSAVPEPDLQVLLRSLKDDIFSSLNCVQIGTVQSYDPERSSCTVSINFRRVIYNQPQQQGQPPPPPAIVAYPILVDVPVIVLNGGGGFISFPIQQGDICLVFFNDRCFDSWWTTGVVAEPNTARCHDMADGIALVGIRSLAHLLGTLSTNSLDLKYSGGIVSIAAKIQIANAATSLLTVLSNVISTLQGWVDTHGDTPSAGTLSNLATNLAQIQSLLR